MELAIEYIMYSNDMDRNQTGILWQNKGMEFPLSVIKVNLIVSISIIMIQKRT